MDHVVHEEVSALETVGARQTVNMTNRVMTRAEAVKALSELGFPTTIETLATLACKGGGPVFRKFGRVPLYTMEDLMAWAESRMSPRMSSNHVPVGSVDLGDP
jgi:hypothetical protein